LLKSVAAAHLLSAIDPATGQPLNDHQVKAEIGTFMAAGFETTSHAIGWTLTLLVSCSILCNHSWLPA
jgi:cytochrome P450